MSPLFPNSRHRFTVVLSSPHWLVWNYEIADFYDRAVQPIYYSGWTPFCWSSRLRAQWICKEIRKGERGHETRQQRRERTRRVIEF